MPATADATTAEPRGWVKSQLNYWGLAWRELEHIKGYRWMRLGSKLISVTLTVTGLAALSIILWLWPLLPPLAWLSIVMGLVVIVSQFTIYLLGRFHERTVGNFENEKRDVLLAAGQDVIRYRGLHASAQSQSDAFKDYGKKMESLAKKVEAERDALKAQLRELSKLKFVVRTSRESEIYIPKPEDDEAIHEGKRTVCANLIVQFENHNTAPNRVMNIEAELLRKTGKGEEKRLKSDTIIFSMGTDNIYGKNRDLILDKAEIPGGGISRLYWLYSTSTIPARYEKLLNQNCFIRVTMEAMRQPPYRVDLYVDWEAARTSKNGRVYISAQNIGSTPSS
jgi:hypothetical protein